MTVSSYDQLRLLRASHPGAVTEAAKARQRGTMPDDGRVMIIAADHPARGAIKVGANPVAMADRRDLIERLCVALATPGCDGVLGTPDILEDLLLLGALEGKMVFGSMNRGGLLGASFEMDDRFTAYDAVTLADMGFDGGKMLTRINMADAGSVATLESSAQAVTALARQGLIAMVEPFMSAWVDGKIKNDLSTNAVILSAAIASGLGATSAYTWLKLPVVENMEMVMASTSLPVLLLGGDPQTSPEETFATWSAAVSLPGCRGLMVGRTLLYPPDEDVAAAVGIATNMVHGGLQ